MVIPVKLYQAIDHHPWSMSCAFTFLQNRCFGGSCDNWCALAGRWSTGRCQNGIMAGSVDGIRCGLAIELLVGNVRVEKIEFNIANITVFCVHVADDCSRITRGQGMIFGQNWWMWVGDKRSWYGFDRIGRLIWFGKLWGANSFYAGGGFDIVHFNFIVRWISLLDFDHIRVGWRSLWHHIDMYFGRGWFDLEWFRLYVCPVFGGGENVFHDTNHFVGFGQLVHLPDRNGFFVEIVVD